MYLIISHQSAIDVYKARRTEDCSAVYSRARSHRHIQYVTGTYCVHMLICIGNMCIQQYASSDGSESQTAPYLSQPWPPGTERQWLEVDCCCTINIINTINTCSNFVLVWSFSFCIFLFLTLTGFICLLLIFLRRHVVYTLNLPINCLLAKASHYNSVTSHTTHNSSPLSIYELFVCCSFYCAARGFLYAEPASLNLLFLRLGIHL